VIQKKPLRIAFYSPDLPDSGSPNGIVTYVRIMRDAMRTIGHSVMVVTGSQIEHFDGEVAPLPLSNPLLMRARTVVESLRHQDGSDPWTRLRVFDAFVAARRAGVDIFEIEESYGWAGRLVGHGVPIVERLHGPHAFVREWLEAPPQRRRGDVREAAERSSFTRVQAVTAPTQLLLDALRDRLGVNPALAEAIPNPIAPAPADSLWTSHRADPDQILFVGRFDFLKGADVVLRAFARAFEQRPSLKLVMVGPDWGLANETGPPTHFDGFVAREIAPQVRPSIKFMGTQPPDRVADLRSSSAFTLVGSRFENFPYSISEAMAVGMPVLTTCTFGGGELVRDGHDGRVVPVGDAEEMANAMLEMSANTDRLAEMGRSARSRVEKWLSPERIATETAAHYDQAQLRL
jgi:glycosyltransferase involved in cell wall biosynthesis